VVTPIVVAAQVVGLLQQAQREHQEFKGLLELVMHMEEMGEMEDGGGTVSAAAVVAVVGIVALVVVVVVEAVEMLHLQDQVANPAQVELELKAQMEVWAKVSTKPQTFLLTLAGKFQS
jgi:hypothetical protein